MTSENEARRIIHLLEAGNLYAECPCPDCGERFLLKDADLFYLDNFSPTAKELYKQQLEELETNKKQLREMRKKIKQRSKISAQAINIGFILERLVPCMCTFPFEPNDCRSLFDPIDYMVFDGLADTGKVERIVFADIKTGENKLTDVQQEIRRLVENKQVEWRTYKPEAKK
jgi:predicted Holliday junction resolvase-like endonuclease